MEKRFGEKVWDCGSPLYDAYELVWLANIIERNMMPGPSSFPSNFFTSNSHEEIVAKKEKKKKLVSFSKGRKKKAKGVVSRADTPPSRQGRRSPWSPHKSRFCGPQFLFYIIYM